MMVARKGDNFIAYADGSCLRNPGPGGWGVVVFVDGNPVTFSGGDPETTNNRMELTAATRALEALPADAKGVLRLDSNYVVKGLAEWRRSWEKNGWRNAKKKAVLNADLWKPLFAVRDQRAGVRVEWVKGHADDPGNNLVDELANTAAHAVLKATPKPKK